MYLVPRLRLGTPYAQGSALRLDAQQAEPAGSCVPRQSLGTSPPETSLARFGLICRFASVRFV